MSQRFLPLLFVTFNFSARDEGVQLQFKTADDPVWPDLQHLRQCREGRLFCRSAIAPLQLFINRFLLSAH
jgi:hypothetical protein